MTNSDYTTHGITMVRIYLTEAEHQAQAIMEILKEQGVSGATLLRAISGFGSHGVMHRADWLDLAGDLPLVLEFADRPETVDRVLPLVLAHTESGHVLRWPVELVTGGAEQD